MPAVLREREVAVRRPAVRVLPRGGIGRVRRPREVWDVEDVGVADVVVVAGEDGVAGGLEAGDVVAPQRGPGADDQDASVGPEARDRLFFFAGAASAATAAGVSLESWMHRERTSLATSSGVSPSGTG